jgi:phosphate transport system ATP-binding protein
VYYSKFRAVKNVSMSIGNRRVTAIIGPSGCGKSTVLRCLNRLHEEAPGGRVTGEVLLDGENIYGPGVDPVLVRRKVGMVFQKPNPFPTMSVLDNVLAGAKLNRFWNNQTELADRAERALRRAALWNEVKDKLKQSGTALSGGQQQRLCIARALAVEPEVLLMDEPCSALDPIATLAIEDLIRELSQDITIVIVTHNMQQAARVSDKTAFFLLGELVEYDATKDMFTNPKDERTEAYITGRFG